MGQDSTGQSWTEVETKNKEENLMAGDRTSRDKIR